MRLLDLYCGAGGSAYGYYLAGFTNIVGIDNVKQKRYPYKFIKADAIKYLKEYGDQYDFIHASPPCQAYSVLKAVHPDVDHPELIEETREILLQLNKPYIIENVQGAPLIDPVMLCGTMFSLRLFRHRFFESNWPLYVPKHVSHKKLGLAVPQSGRQPSHDGEVWSIYGHFSGVDGARKAMGISWMVRDELSQAIPPAYTEYLGKQIIERLK